MAEQFDREKCESVLVRYIDEVLNKHNDDLLPEVFHPEFEHETDESALGFEHDGRDLEGIKLGMIEMREKLDPTYHAEIIRWEDDTVILDWRFEGVHKATVMGLVATNRPFVITYTGWCRFKDNKMVAAKSDFDPARVLEQVMPQLYPDAVPAA